ncbi:Putative voltage-gated potassium channel subunit beta [Verticillium dahliae VDG1]|nr:Putative voltage-gated potassium channel subunit beta [Verticillium dahliae VDG1]
MSDPKGGEPKSKKRKLNNQNVLKVGNKVISLEGYLNPPAKKPAPQPEPFPAVTVSEQPKKTAAEREGASVQKERKSRQPQTTEDGASSKHRKDKKPLAKNGPTSRWKEDPVLLESRKKLPIWAHRDEIKSKVRQNDVVVLVGETGSGKSTQVPQFLTAEPWCRRKTVKEAGTPLRPGAEGMVGYSVRFDHNVPKGTKIKFVTEGMLLQELLHDPHLRQYSAIVVDEIHERSVDVDLLSGFLKQILLGDLSGRGGIPLKVVIMSATADVERIQHFFSEAAPVLEDEEAPVPSANKAISVGEMRIPGRQFLVQTIHLPRAIPDIQDSLLKSIFRIHTEEPLPGDILAFLTGQEEIEAAQGLIEEYAATLASNLPKIRVFPLFGQLSIEAQHEAFKPIKGGFTRKVVLATNIAETSVTVPGVRYVVDCGKAKVKQYRSRLGMESLLAKPISKSSAIQRTGRAGREGPGKCYRLYPEDAFNTLEDTDLPEILRIDVLGAVLTMKARGIDDVLSFPLMDAPAIDSIEKALIHLHGLGALADDGSITPAGRKMAAFPVSAPLGAVLLAAATPQFDCLLDVIDLYAAENADRTLWCKKRRVNLRNMKTAMNIRRQLRALCLKEALLAEAPPPDPQPFAPLAPERAESLLKCFLRGFVSKTAVLAPDASYVTSQGKHVVAIHPASVLHGQKREAIMFLEHVYTQKNYAKKVSVIQANWIIEALQGGA